LALLTFAKGVVGCSCYSECHCYNADGVPYDNATETVCNRFVSGATKFTDGRCQYIGQVSVTRYPYTHYIGLDNCDWRTMCAEAGATGADSSCDNK
ncbi:hypothetical protein LX32DRAFT_505196, partial [Colletotrichum zoysiae]